MTKFYDILFRGNKGILIIVLCLLVILLLDTFLIKFYDLMDKKIILIEYKKLVFTFLVAFSIILQFLILKYVKNLVLNEKNNTQMNLRVIDKVYALFLYVEGIVFAVIILQLFYFNYYNSTILIIILSASYIPAILFMGQSMKSFLSWLKMNRNLTLFLYSLSMFFIIINLIITNLIVGIGINDRPENIRQFVGGTMDISSGNYRILADLLKITSVLSFLSIWIITALIIQTTGSKKKVFVKWTLLLIPLIYFLISYFSEDIFYSLLSPLFQSDPINASLIFSAIFILSKPVGGLTFGILYWRISKLVKYNNLLRQFMILAGIGFLFLYSANQATLLVLTPFPPFGIITVTLLVPATFLIYIGIYRSAIIASADAELRRYIHNTAKESKLLQLISQSEMEKELNKVVNKVYHFVDDTADNNPPEMEPGELRKYIEDVISELKEKGTKNQEA